MKTKIIARSNLKNREIARLAEKIIALQLTAQRLRAEIFFGLKLNGFKKRQIKGGNNMKALIAVWAAVMVFGVAFCAESAFCQDASLSAKVISPYQSFYDLNAEDADEVGINSSGSVRISGVNLRGARVGLSSMSGKQGIVMAEKILLPQEKEANPWVVNEEGVSVTYRDVKCIYHEYIHLFAPHSEVIDIVESETGALVCKITLHIGIDANGEYYTERTVLEYVDADGFNVTVTMAGKPDLDALLHSASIAEGVYYGMADGKITKARSAYDANGNRVLGIEKTTYFDEKGNIIREEVLKESSLYNSDGNLIRQSVYFKVDGKVQWVKTTNRVYIGKRLYLETKNTTSYNDDGTIASFTLEQANFDNNGNEVRYSLEAYEKGLKAHSITRQTSRNADGEITDYLFEEKWYSADGKLASERKEVTKFNDQTGDYLHSDISASYDANGNVTGSTTTIDEEKYGTDGKIAYKRHFYTTATRAGWGPFAGQLTTTHEEETITEYVYDGDGDLAKEHEYGYWFTTYIDPWFDKLTTFLYDVVGGVKKIINKHIFRIEAEDKDFTKVTIRYTEDVTNHYNKDTGMLESVESSSEDIRYDGNGTVTSTVTKRDSETYDATGTIVKKYHFYRQASPWYEHEEETITDYVYDSDGDLATEHEYGYWFTTYRDPWFDKITTFLYDIVNGVKKLINKSVTRIEAEDKDFVRLTSYYLEDSMYNYDSNGGLSSVHTSIIECNFSNGALTSTKETLADETYRGGTLSSRTTTITVNGALVLQESATYNERGDLTFHSKSTPDTTYLETREYYDDGTLRSVAIQSKTNYGESYLESREYYENGKIKSVDIVSDRPADTMYRIKLRLPDSTASHTHYELRENYRDDGQMTHREEVVRDEYINDWWGPYYVIEKYDSKAVGCIYQWWTRYSIETRSVEDWEYSADGTLTHYKKEYSSSRTNQDDWWDRGTGVAYNETIERSYDPDSGKIISEKYTRSGYENLRKIEPYRDGGWAEAIPEDVNKFLNSVMDSFYSRTSVNQELGISYRYDDAGNLVGVDVSWTENGGWETTYAFFCTVVVENGKIKELIVSESGEREGGDIAIDYPKKTLLDDGSQPHVRTNTEKSIDCDLSQRLGAIEAQAAQRALPQGIKTAEMIATYAQQYGCKLTLGNSDNK